MLQKVSLKLKCPTCGKSKTHKELFIIKDKHICEWCGAEEVSDREVSLNDLILHLEYKGKCILPKVEEECLGCDHECVINTLIERVDSLNKKIKKLQKKSK